MSNLEQNIWRQVLVDPRTDAMIKTIRRYGERHWTPATSSNFSYRFDDKHIVITRSGVHKRLLKKEDLMLIDPDGKVLAPEVDLKSSAETQIHLCIYKEFPKTQCVLHTHSTMSTSFGIAHDELVIEGLELIKAYEGRNTHEDRVKIQVVENSQDMLSFRKHLELTLKDLNVPAFLIRGHGIYAWGESIFAADRHLEVTEFFLETEFLKKMWSR